MAGEIRVTPETVRSTGKTFQDAATASREQVQKVDSSMQALESEWDGVAQQAFYQRFNEWKTQMAQHEELLRTIGTNLDSIASAFEERDREIAQQLNSAG